MAFVTPALPVSAFRRRDAVTSKTRRDVVMMKSAQEAATVESRRDGNLPGRPDAKTYQVRVHDPKKGITHVVDVPEDRYIWSAMSEAGEDVPSSCRNGCCTTCAVKITGGEVDQGEALGLLKEMRANGYALLCVSYPRSDIECTLQDEDEVYMKQFGSSFEGGGVEWGGVLPDEEH